jgi:ribosomal protein S18 acetylase RimI-like enzyme
MPIGNTDKKITLTNFAKVHYEEYLNWFKDEAVQKYLGSIDEEWLDHILNDEAGEELVAMLDGKMVGVVGVTFPVKEHPYYVITSLAVHPELTRKGIGTRIIHLLKDFYLLRKGEHWVTYVHINNRMAQHFMRKLGWVRGVVCEEMITYTDL